MDKIDKVMSYSIKFLKYFIGILMMISCTSMLYQVIARFILKTSSAWTEELARFTCVWMVFFAAAIGNYEGNHINVTILDILLSNKNKQQHLNALKVFRYIIQIFFYILIIFCSLAAWKFTIGQTSPNMGLRMDLIYAVIPISALLSIIYLIYITIKNRREAEIK